MVKTTNNLQMEAATEYVICTIGKSAPKRLQFKNPVPFPLRESAYSIFHTNLYGARKSHNITAQILSHAFPPTAHVSYLFLMIYTKLVYFSYPSSLGNFGLFQDILRILKTHVMHSPEHWRCVVSTEMVAC